MSENEKEEFAFIKEKIKNKPLNKRRIILKTAFTVVLAVVFGLMEQYLKGKLSPASESQATAMLNRRIAYGSSSR